MALHVFDGSEWHVAPDMATAILWADQSIDLHRDCCEPEWPDGVQQVAIYEAPDDAEYPDEGRLVMRAVECDKRPDPTGACDYWCDYRM